MSRYKYTITNEADEDFEEVLTKRHAIVYCNGFVYCKSERRHRNAIID